MGGHSTAGETVLMRIKRECQEHNSPTLGIFKPGLIDCLTIDEEDADWSAAELEKLNQTLDLFEQAPVDNWKKYRIVSNIDLLATIQIVVVTLSRVPIGRWGNRIVGGEGSTEKIGENAFRQKYEVEMKERFDTHFFVGNMHQYPNSFLIVGLYYPPFQQMPDLFDGI